MSKIKQHEQVTEFCRKYSELNVFNPNDMEQYNKKFKADFYRFLDENNFDDDIKSFYKTNN